jgi:uncharacterized protein (TIGR00288 family)
MTLTDTRSTRIAVFIDFDNVEIGVKSTIGGQFDIGLVLEAIKERGEIVTKIAYSDWKRAGDYSRLLSQHAIRMVQRNLTPGGDKNGADITMALDALEMAFTHDHINAFVIVGGDSDFISLVEKLKQYGRTVIVVGGRQFTSQTMQKNCHEFIAYENLVGSSHRGAPRGGERGAKPHAGTPHIATSQIAQALPLVKRALKVLSDREVSPQLGLLKSTLLQLDSTFSEREYGAGSFRDFMEKVAQAGAVTLKHSGRSMLVEPVEDGEPIAAAPAAAETPASGTSVPGTPVSGTPAAGGPQASAPQASRHERESAHPSDEDEEQLPASPMTMQDGIKAVQRAFAQAATPPRFPMYVRQAKAFLRSAIDGFDERKYGFASVVDLLRAAGKEGVLRIDRDRQGAVRVFPGANLMGRPPVQQQPAPDAGTDADVEAAAEPVDGEPVAAEAVAEAPIVDGETVEPPADVDVVAVDAPKKGARKRKAAAPRATKPAAGRTAKPRARKTARSKSEAADR